MYARPYCGLANRENIQGGVLAEAGEAEGGSRRKGLPRGEAVLEELTRLPFLRHPTPKPSFWFHVKLWEGQDC